MKVHHNTKNFGAVSLQPTHTHQFYSAVINITEIFCVIMTDHLQLIKVEVEKSLKEVELDWATSAKEKEEAKKSKAPVFNSILGYTEQKIIINGTPQLIHRVFVETLDSGEYVKCGWVLKCDVSCCMVCAVKFHPAQGFFPWSEEALEKISCHACGNVICVNCSLEAVVKEIFKLGPLPVCSQCSYGQVRNIQYYIIYYYKSNPYYIFIIKFLIGYCRDGISLIYAT